MADVLNLQGDSPETPDEEKASYRSLFACAGKNVSNGSWVFC